MKPVAWMYYDERKNLQLCQTIPPYDNSFPVYTEPRELSDEEIDECLYATDWSYDPHSFARAILKKASEK